jgi:hypothetical protein
VNDDSSNVIGIRRPKAPALKRLVSRETMYRSVERLTAEVESWKRSQANAMAVVLHMLERHGTQTFSVADLESKLPDRVKFEMDPSGRRLTVSLRGPEPLDPA